MMINAITQRQIAVMLNKEAASQGFSLTLRPWNRFEPDVSDWWLVPTTEWPAFKYAKVFISHPELVDRDFYLSLHVEKGLGNEYVEAYPGPKSRRQQMKDDWAWHGLIHDLSNGSNQSEILAMSKAGKVEPVIFIEGMYAPDADSFDPYLYDYKKDQYYIVVGLKENVLEIISSSVEAQLLGRIDTVDSFDDLSYSLKKLTDNPWIWINYHVGFFLSKPETGLDSVDASKMWCSFEVFKTSLQSIT